MFTYCHELTCGCIQHDLVGFIRKCQGLTSRTLSGKMATKPDGAEQRHNHAVDTRAVRVYEVAPVLP